MKAKFLVLLALVLGVVSCQTEPEGLDVNVGGEQLVTVNVAVPEAETRAVELGSNKGVFNTTILDDDNTTMRYILQVYLKNDDGTLTKSAERKVEWSDGKSANFEVRLVPGRNYQFVAWADVVVEGKKDVDNHYNTEELTEVTLIEPATKWRAMDESRDAFTASIPVNNYSGTSTIDLKLTRPFAKLRVVTTDIENLTNLGIVPAKAEVSYSSKHYESFNAVEGKVNGTDSERDQIVSYTYDINIVNDKNIYGEGNKATEFTIFADYFFANDETIKFTLDVKDSEGTPIKSNSFVTDINVKRNYLTTIKGNILTDGKGFEVKIEDGFAGEIERPVVEVHDANALQDAINNAEDGKETTITLGGDIDLNDLLNAGILSTRAGEKFGITIAAGKKLSLDLNGFTLSGESATAGDTMITNNGELNIVNGTVTYKYTGEPDSTYGKGNYAIVNSGELTVNANINIVAGTVGAKFPHALYVIQNAGELVIDGGKILNNTNIAIRNWVGSETKPSNITINGGEIEGLRGIWNQLPNSNADLAPKANIVINGGTLTGTAIDGKMDSDNILAIYSYTYGNQAKNVNIEVNGGTINGDIALTGGTNKNYVEKLTINGGKFNGLWGDVYSYADDALAKDAITIKGGEFSSIAPLVYLNAADEVVKLGKNIENAEPIVFKGEGTLNLNGKSVSAVDDTEKNYQLIDNRGKLAVVGDGTMTVEATINSGWGRYSAVIANNPGGNLTVNGATLEHLGGTDMAYGIDNLTNGKGTYAVTTVENATIKSPYRAVRQFLNGVEATNELYVKAGAKLEGGNKSIFFQDPNVNANTGKLVVEEGAELYGDVYLFVAEGSTEWPVEVSIVKSALKNGSEVISANTPGAKDVVEENGVYTVGVVVTEVDGAYEVASVAGLKAIAKFVNGGDDFKGKTIKLAADIDLNNENWTAIGTEEANFCGTFDGCDYTIKNLKILVSEGKEEKAFLGLFGYAKNATIKNVVFENVDINVACLDIDHSQGHIGAVAGSLEGTSTIENVTVKGDVKVYATQDANGASRVAVVAGGNSYGNVTMKNVHVIANEGSYLIANNNTGALAGQLQGKSVFENCSSNIDVTVNKFFAGGIIGLAAGDQTFTNCHTTGNIAVVAGREGKAHDHYRVGGIAGGWADGNNKVCTLVNCSYTGKISGTNADGSVATVFDYAGYVGRGYTLNGCQGSTVSIDGVRYVQKYNTADQAGIYDVYDAEGNLIVADGVTMNAEGEYLITKAAGMFWFANEVNVNKNSFAGKTVKLAANIDLENEAWTPVGQTGATTFNGVFDGQDYTISNLNVNSEAQTGAHYSSGLFGWVESHSAGHGHLKNVKIVGATIVGNHNCGALVGYITDKNALVENCHVTGAAVSCLNANSDANGDKAGALIGNATVDTPVKDCTAANSTVSAGRDAGQVIGAGKEANVTGCSATNVTVEANGTGTGNNVRNEVIGRLLS